MKLRIWCTLGPASLVPDIIQGLDERGVDWFRINLSHTRLETIEETIALIRRYSSTPICLDTEGAQVRCGEMIDGVLLQPGTEICLTSENVEGTEKLVRLWPPSVFQALEIGSELSLDFDGAVIQVAKVGEIQATGTVVVGGRVRSNKAVTVNPPPVLPALTEKDIAAIQMGTRLGVAQYALSFASSGDDVTRLRSLAPAGAHIIAKIESRSGVRNMDGIIHAANAIVIDRGDLSREVPIEHVPFYQKAIIRRANRWSRPVHVATNLLESMVYQRRPTVAEANDIANTLLDGVHGLVLAAETAVGIDPLGSVDMVIRVVNAFERAGESQLLEEDRAQPGTLGPTSTDPNQDPMLGSTAVA